MIEYEFLFLYGRIEFSWYSKLINLRCYVRVRNIICVTVKFQFSIHVLEYGLIYFSHKSKCIETNASFCAHCCCEIKLLSGTCFFYKSIQIEFNALLRYTFRMCLMRICAMISLNKMFILKYFYILNFPYEYGKNSYYFYIFFYSSSV